MKRKNGQPNGSPTIYKDKIGAQERTRTSTPLRELAPEASASANSATWAFQSARKTRVNREL
jgi:hypothetical protein